MAQSKRNLNPKPKYIYIYIYIYISHCFTICCGIFTVVIVVDIVLLHHSSSSPSLLPLLLYYVGLYQFASRSLIYALMFVYRCSFYWIKVTVSLRCQKYKSVSYYFGPVVWYLWPRKICYINRYEKKLSPAIWNVCCMWVFLTEDLFPLLIPVKIIVLKTHVIKY